MESNSDALEAAILAAPDDLERWAVYGDLLQERGDARGEIIGLEEEIRRLGESEARRAKLAALIAAHRGQWLGPELAALCETDGNPIEVDLTHGFILGARIGLVGIWENIHPIEILEALFERPAARLLHSLVLGLFGPEQTDYTEVVGFLAEEGPERSLRELVIGDVSRYHSSISMFHVGPLTELLRAMPELRILRARGVGIDLEQLRHDKLERLTLETTALPRGAARAVARGRAPRLTHLEIWLGSPDLGGDASIADLEGLWSGEGFPSLRHLGLRNSVLTDDIAERITRSNLLAQLETLDLSLGTMHERGAEILLRHADALRHLRKISLGRNYIDISFATILQRTIGEAVEIGQQNFPYFLDGEDAYYVAIRE